MSSLVSSGSGRVAVAASDFALSGPDASAMPPPSSEVPSRGLTTGGKHLRMLASRCAHGMRRRHPEARHSTRRNYGSLADGGCSPADQFTTYACSICDASRDAVLRRCPMTLPCDRPGTHRTARHMRYMHVAATGTDHGWKPSAAEHPKSRARPALPSHDAALLRRCAPPTMPQKCAAKCSRTHLSRKRYFGVGHCTKQQNSIIIKNIM